MRVSRIAGVATMQKSIVTMFLFAVVLGCSTTARSADTKELVKSEGLFGLLCDNRVPDCVHCYCCPDYCKKPLPKPCGPLPPNLSCGCGPRKWWRFGFRNCPNGRVDCGSGCNDSCTDRIETQTEPAVGNNNGPIGVGLKQPE